MLATAGFLGLNGSFRAENRSLSAETVEKQKPTSL